MQRRDFLTRAAWTIGAVAAGSSMGFDPLDDLGDNNALRQPEPEPPLPPRPDYDGPNVILVRFGGGVRPQETVHDGSRTYAPFLYHELGRKQGTIFPNVVIDSRPGIETSHGQGTLYLLCGEFRHYEDVTGAIIGDRFEPVNPTLFEYFRKTYNIPPHQALIVNGENRISEEFYTFSNHPDYGFPYRSTVLSLYRFKTYLIRRRLAEGGLPDRTRRELEWRLRRMVSQDYRVRDRELLMIQNPEIDRFWERWRAYYGDSGFVNPRGDRLLTTLALWAMRHLRPRLMMINYNDPDYVHWGIAGHYTRAVSIIDEGIRRIYESAQADEFYRDRTVFVIVPDCGRDNNRCMPVPYQHHFNAHEVFAVVAGPSRYVPHAGRVVDRELPQIAVTPTIGRLMNFATPHACPDPLPL